MLERSAQHGGHGVFKRTPGRTILECQVLMAHKLDCEMDTNAHDINRVFFSTTDSPDDLLYLSPELFVDDYNEEAVRAEAELLRDREANGLEILPPGAHNPNKHYRVPREWNPEAPEAADTKEDSGQNPSNQTEETYKGLKYSEIIGTYWKLFYNGQTPKRGSRNDLTYELANHLRNICDYDKSLMMRVIPCYDGLSEAEKERCITSALSGKRTAMSKRMRDVLSYLQRRHTDNPELVKNLDEVEENAELYYYRKLPNLSRSIKDSIEACGPKMAMPVILAVCTVIGSLAADVKITVHRIVKNLNLLSYICGKFSSGKSLIDRIIDAWTCLLREEDDVLLAQEAAYRQSLRASKNKQNQPAEKVFPIRNIALNNTIPNIVERLSNLKGLHAFSFSCESDNVSQRWKGSLPEFSVLVRQAFDGSRFEREAKSLDSVSAHIDKLVWNIVMCGTPDALHRLFPNAGDGTLSRFMIGRMPDNTFTPLEDNPPCLKESHRENIRQVAELLPLMKGNINSIKLENKGREWLEHVRLESLKNNDEVMASFRIRVCVNAQVAMGCLLVVAAATRLLKQHGLEGAKEVLTKDPECWLKMQNSLMKGKFLDIYDLIADYLLDNLLYYFRKKMEAANGEASKSISNDRRRKGKNDSIFSRLPQNFSLEVAEREGLAVRGTSFTQNAVRQMLKNWKNQKLIKVNDDNTFTKLK